MLHRPVPKFMEHCSYALADVVIGTNGQVHELEDDVRRQRMGEVGWQRTEHEVAWEFSVPQLQRAYTDGLALSCSAPAAPR